MNANTKFKNWCSWVVGICVIFIYYAVCIYLLLLFFFVSLKPHLQHMEVPRLGVESKL